MDITITPTALKGIVTPPPSKSQAHRLLIAAALGGTFQSPLAAYSFLVFVLLYVPCVAAVSTIHKEMNSTRWTLASIGWQLGAAWLGSFLVYQIGSLVLRVI